MAKNTTKPTATTTTDNNGNLYDLEFSVSFSLPTGKGAEPKEYDNGKTYRRLAQMTITSETLGIMINGGDVTSITDKAGVTEIVARLPRIGSGVFSTPVIKADTAARQAELDQWLIMLAQSAVEWRQEQKKNGNTTPTAAPRLVKAPAVTASLSDLF